MGKINELELAIKELRSAATTINEVTNALMEMFSTATDTAPDAIAPAEPEKPTVTLAQVRAALADKSRAGHTAEVRALLQQFGASRLSEVDPQHYAALLQEAEVM